MITIHQLAKASRRIPCRIANAQRHLQKATSPSRVDYWERNLMGWLAAKDRLDAICFQRNIGGPPLRDCTPHKKRT